jgi:hypothetical protein
MASPPPRFSARRRRVVDEDAAHDPGRDGEEWARFCQRTRRWSISLR